MNIAFIHFKESKIAETVYDHIKSFKQYSRHHILYMTPYSSFLTKKNLEKFDVVVIHYNVFLLSEDRFPPHLKFLLRQITTKKVIFMQDEYQRINTVVSTLRYIKADLLFTCFPEEEIEKVYPTKNLPGLKKINTLTGFVPERLLNISKTPYEKRSLDVGYRSRKVPLRLGKLGQEKWRISDKFELDAENFDLKCDLSTKEEDRIYGEKWIKFLLSSKATLGCESGASVIDFTGEIQRKTDAYEIFNPYVSPEKVEKLFFPGLDGKIPMNQISPRCFECAALGTLMILYEGKYSGVLVPWRHYVPLKKDHSNMEEIVSVLKDKKRWHEITSAAYKEIALNPLYSYKNFVQNFDEQIEKIVPPFSVKSSLPLGEVDLQGVRKKRLTRFVEVVIRLSPLWSRIIKRTPVVGRYHGFFLDIYHNLFLYSKSMGQLRLKNVRKYGALFLKDSQSFKELFLITQMISYVENVRELSQLNILCCQKKDGADTVLFLGETNLKEGTVIYTARDIDISCGKLKIFSENSPGIPASLRNIDVELKSASQILNLLS